MTMLGWVLGLFMPLCGTAGAHGITPPGVVDYQHFTPQSHSEAFVTPAGFTATPNFVAKTYHVPAAQLYHDLNAVAAAQPRSFVLDQEPDALQSAYVARTALANFPDIVEFAVIPIDADNSSYIFYSHSIYGADDGGVNLARARKYAAALDAKEALR